MEKTLNNYFKVIFVFQIVATMISAILHGVLLKTHPKVSRYAVEHKSIVVSVMQTWGSWFLSFSNLIPISLLVTVDLVRWGQSNLLQKD
jgi:magnesium-transporting ATPase (P-type)